MASGRKSGTKIKSVQNTRKITKAMEMVAASKMRKAQQRMQSAPYAERSAASPSLSQAKHQRLQASLPGFRRQGWRGDRSDHHRQGLCGGLNITFSGSRSSMKNWEAEESPVQGNRDCGPGTKMQRLRANIISLDRPSSAIRIWKRS